MRHGVQRSFSTESPMVVLQKALKDIRHVDSLRKQKDCIKKLFQAKMLLLFFQQDLVNQG